jgi:hypothetical protein
MRLRHNFQGIEKVTRFVVPANYRFLAGRFRNVSMSWQKGLSTKTDMAFNYML